ncbi:MAG: hypothetical protein EBU46_09760 [Nitrosomonadaceae bacterium]|nr:hypothetical protein [Nitrosomonadaceae bacterium]
MDYRTIIDSLQTWMKGCFTFNSSLQPARGWCRLGSDDLTQAGLNEQFDTSEQDKEVVGAISAKSRQATAYKIAEIDLIHGVHKCMVARHKPRLGYYRDDTASKHYHNWKAISLGTGNFLAQKERTETANGNS